MSACSSVPGCLSLAQTSPSQCLLLRGAVREGCDASEVLLVYIFGYMALLCIYCTVRGQSFMQFKCGDIWALTKESKQEKCCRGTAHWETSRGGHKSTASLLSGGCTATLTTHLQPLSRAAVSLQLFPLAANGAREKCATA